MLPDVSPGLPFALLAFALVLALGGVWFRRAMAVRVPASRLPYVVGMVGGAALGIVAFVLGPGWLGGALAAVAVAGAAVFLATIAISRQVGGSGAFRVGEGVPDFTAPDENGAVFTLSSLAGQPLLLKFFRGHW
jgi:hypothetical protein